MIKYQKLSIVKILRRIGWVVMSIPKVLKCKIVYHKNSEVSWFEHFERGSRITFEEVRGIFKIEPGVHIKRGTELLLSGSGSLSIGRHVAINSNCYLAAHELIQVGDYSAIGQNVVIVDHNHDFRASGGLATQAYNSRPIKLGKNVWIGANSVILMGAEIGDNSVVGAGTVVTAGHYEANSIIFNKRELAIRKY